MILDMIEELSHYHRTKDEIMQQAVVTRLNASYESYVHELNNSLEFLKKRNELSLLKRINKSNGSSCK